MKRKYNILGILTILLVCFAPSIALAAKPIILENSGHLAWLLMASVLVIFMTVPGIALFYGGLSPRKNALSVIAECFVIVAIISLLWVIIGYTLSFGSRTAIIGNFHDTFLMHLSLYAGKHNASRIVFVFFQMGFAVITVAIITGSFSGRMKFSAIIVFIILWEIFVYYPVAHWVWSNGWLERLGELDYAGGTVVHINAGIAGLVAAIMVGRRKIFCQKTPERPHNIILVAIGTAILWIGWFGFNAGSGSNFLHAPTVAIITQIATCSSLLTWMALSWAFSGKPSVLSMCLGAVVGLVAITPASGYVGLLGAIVIGILASAAGFFLIHLKYLFNYDDSLDAFGIHGIGGIIGSLLTGIFFTKTLGGSGHDGFSMGYQFLVQLISTVAVIIWSALISFIILYVIKWVIGLRVMPESEEIGLDIAIHGETD